MMKQKLQISLIVLLMIFVGLIWFDEESRATGQMIFGSVQSGTPYPVKTWVTQPGTIAFYLKNDPTMIASLKTTDPDGIKLSEQVIHFGSSTAEVIYLPKEYLVKHHYSVEITHTISALSGSGMIEGKFYLPNELEHHQFFSNVAVFQFSRGAGAVPEDYHLFNVEELDEFSYSPVRIRVFSNLTQQPVYDVTSQTGRLIELFPGLLSWPSQIPAGDYTVVLEKVKPDSLEPWKIAVPMGIGLTAGGDELQRRVIVKDQTDVYDLQIHSGSSYLWVNWDSADHQNFTVLDVSLMQNQTKISPIVLLSNHTVIFPVTAGIYQLEVNNQGEKAIYSIGEMQTGGLVEPVITNQILWHRLSPDYPKVAYELEDTATSVTIECENRSTAKAILHTTSSPDNTEVKEFLPSETSTPSTLNINFSGRKIFWLHCVEGEIFVKSVVGEHRFYPVVDAEENETVSTAQPITTTTQIFGTLSGKEDQDYYSFTLQKRSMMHIRLDKKPADCSPELILFDQAQNQIGSTDSVNEVYAIRKLLNPGTYYVAVSVTGDPSAESYALNCYALYTIETADVSAAKNSVSIGYQNSKTQEISLILIPRNDLPGVKDFTDISIIQETAPKAVIAPTSAELRQFYRLRQPDWENAGAIEETTFLDTVVDVETDQMEEPYFVQNHATASRVGTASVNTPPQVGMVKKFYIQPANRAIQEEFVLQAVRENCLVWVNTKLAPVYSVRMSEQLADVYESNRESLARLFGREPMPADFSILANNEYLNIMLCPLTTKGGYFVNRDLYSKTAIQQGGLANQYSNEGKFVYINNHINTISFNGLANTLLHEVQHLIFYNEKILSKRSITMADSWINESFSAIAGNLHNFGYDLNVSHITGSIDIQIKEFYQNSWGCSLLADRKKLDPKYNSSMYGAYYLFGSFLYNRFGEGVFQAVATSPDDPRQSLANFTGLSFDTLIEEWALTMLFDSEEMTDPQYQYSYPSGIRLPKLYQRYIMPFSRVTKFDSKLKWDGITYFKTDGPMQGDVTKVTFIGMQGDYRVIILRKP